MSQTRFVYWRKHTVRVQQVDVGSAIALDHEASATETLEEWPTKLGSFPFHVGMDDVLL